MADLERRVGLLEKALVEQGKVIAVLKKERQEMEEALNEIADAAKTNIEQLWENQQVHEIQLISILHAIDPENNPLPEELKEVIDAQSNRKAPQDDTGTPVH